MIAVARKLAVLLHRLWVTGDVYMPLLPGGQATLPAVAWFSSRCMEVQCHKPSSGDCVIG
jgi:hypothetical protein